MKRLSVLLASVAMLCAGMSSCDKIEEGVEKVNRELALPSFERLYGYVGRTDVETLSQEFRDKGYSVDRDGEWMTLTAYNQGVDESYSISLHDGEVTSCTYTSHFDADARMRILAKVAEEVTFRDQSELVHFSGGCTHEGNRTSTSDKTEMFATISSLDLTKVESLYYESLYSGEVWTDIRISNYDEEGYWSYSVGKGVSDDDDPEDPNPVVPDGVHVTFGSKSWTAMSFDATLDGENNWHLLAYEQPNSYDALLCVFESPKVKHFHAEIMETEEELTGYSSERLKSLKYYTKNYDPGYGSEADWWGKEVDITIDEIDMDNATISISIEATMFSYEEWLEDESLPTTDEVAHRDLQVKARKVSFVSGETLPAAPAAAKRR